MKGTIHYCLEETIKHKFGKEKWEHCLQELNLAPDFTFGRTILQDLDESKSLDLFVDVAKSLDISLKVLFDEFGVYWCCEYAPKMYPQFFKENSSTKELLTELDTIHQKVIGKKPGATPPRFKYDWQEDGRLLITYNSQRGLFELFESLLRGLDVRFNNNTEITRMEENQLLLKFSN